MTQRNYAQGQYIGTTAYFYTHDHLGSVREEKQKERNKKNKRGQTVILAVFESTPIQPTQ
ncbi:MAG: hypothetical protein DME97_00095 [Verrucomicrobia bacterium]|nr:MAG: hypothetical protein DME97_00095 [Verrucomicrobiota bacterium]